MRKWEGRDSGKKELDMEWNGCECSWTLEGGDRGVRRVCKK